MGRARFGSRKHSTFGVGQRIEVLPERKIVPFRDFTGGYKPGIPRHLIDDGSSPRAYDVVIREDKRIQRAPGTLEILSFDGEYQQPQQMALHPTLQESVEVALISPPFVGFYPGLPEHDNLPAYKEAGIQWYDLGFADRGEFAHTTFGGTMIFTDGLKTWYRDGYGAEPKEAEVPVARDYASFGARLYGFGAIIDGKWEPLGVRWSAADSNFNNWDGFGSGFELLVNDVATGDAIMKAVPMGLDAIAVLLRHSIWYGRFTGDGLRPADFMPRVSGVGTVNRSTAVLSRFGPIFLSDNGVYNFDGNEATLISDDINSVLLPLDYDRINEYRATYDPMRKRYILVTPFETWIFEVEKGRWLRRTMTVADLLMYPRQIDPTLWFELVGDWNNQSEFVWLDYAGKQVGGLELLFLGDQFVGEQEIEDPYEPYEYPEIETIVHRVLAMESMESDQYFGRYFRPYWQTKMIDEQDSSVLVTIKKLLLEYQGRGVIRIHLPDLDGRYVPRMDVRLGQRAQISLASVGLNRTSKGTGVAIEMFPFASDIVDNGIQLPDGEVVGFEAMEEDLNAH